MDFAAAFLIVIGILASWVSAYFIGRATAFRDMQRAAEELVQSIHRR